MSSEKPVPRLLAAEEEPLERKASWAEIAAAKQRAEKYKPRRSSLGSNIDFEQLKSLAKKNELGSNVDFDMLDSIKEKKQEKVNSAADEEKEKEKEKGSEEQVKKEKEKGARKNSLGEIEKGKVAAAIKKEKEEKAEAQQQLQTKSKWRIKEGISKITKSKDKEKEKEKEKEKDMEKEKESKTVPVQSLSASVTVDVDQANNSNTSTSLFRFRSSSKSSPTAKKESEPLASSIGKRLGQKLLDSLRQHPTEPDIKEEGSFNFLQRSVTSKVDPIEKPKENSSDSSSIYTLRARTSSAYKLFKEDDAPNRKASTGEETRILSPETIALRMNALYFAHAVEKNLEILNEVNEFVNYIATQEIKSIESILKFCNNRGDSDAPKQNHASAFYALKFDISKSYCDEISVHQEVVKQFCNPLKIYYSQNSRKLKKLTTKVSESLELINSSKADLQTLSLEFEKSYSAYVKALASEKNMQSSNLLGKLVERVKSTFEAYNEKFRVAADARTNLWKSILPEVVMELEGLERDRIRFLNDRVDLYGKLRDSLLMKNEPRQIVTHSMKESLSILDIKYVDKMVKKYSHPISSSEIYTPAEIVPEVSQELSWGISARADEVDALVKKYESATNSKVIANAPKEVDLDTVWSEYQIDLSQEDRNAVFCVAIKNAQKLGAKFLDFSEGDVIRLEAIPKDSDEILKGELMRGYPPHSTGFLSKRMVQLVAPNENIPFIQCVYLPTFRECFLKFVRATNSEAGMLFWLGANEFYERPTLEGARYLVNEFIADDSPHQINLSSANKKKVLEEFSYMNPLNADLIRKEMFCDCQIEVFHVLNKDSYPKFKKSVLFSNYLTQLQVYSSSSFHHFLVKKNSSDQYSK
jgi:hypothetical protein